MPKFVNKKTHLISQVGLMEAPGVEPECSEFPQAALLRVDSKSHPQKETDDLLSTFPPTGRRFTLFSYFFERSHKFFPLRSKFVREWGTQGEL